MSRSSWDIRKALRAERERADLSLAQLAAATGLSKTYLVRLETDKTANPSLEVLGRLADALDVTIADLVGSSPLQFDLNESTLSVSLKKYAANVGLSHGELRTLASIRWRKSEEPQTPERWEYIHQQLRMSRQIDDEQST